SIVVAVVVDVELEIDAKPVIDHVRRAEHSGCLGYCWLTVQSEDFLPCTLKPNTSVSLVDGSPHGDCVEEQNVDSLAVESDRGETETGFLPVDLVNATDKVGIILA